MSDLSEPIAPDDGEKRARKTQTPVDQPGFIAIVADAHTLLSRFKKSLAVISPKITSDEFLALSRLAAPAEDGPAAVKPGLLRGLVRKELATVPRDGVPVLTADGQRVLEQATAIVAEIVEGVRAAAKPVTSRKAKSLGRASKVMRTRLKAQRGEAAAEQAEDTPAPAPADA